MNPQEFSPQTGPNHGASRPPGPTNPAVGGVPPIVRAPVMLGGQSADAYAAGPYPPLHDIYAPTKPAVGQGSSRSAVPVVLALLAIVGGFVVLLGCGGLLLLARLADQNSGPQARVRTAYPQRTYARPTYPQPTAVTPPRITITPPEPRPFPTLNGTDTLDRSQQMFEEMHKEQQRIFDEQRRRVDEQMELSRQRHQQFLDQIRTGPTGPQSRSGRSTPPSLPRVPRPPTAPQPPGLR